MRYLSVMPVKHLSVAGGRNRARMAVQQAMHDKGIPSLDHVLGEQQTASFLSSRSAWPNVEQAQRIELLLEWPYGTIDAIVHRPPLNSLDGPGQALVTMIADMTARERTALLELVRVTKIRARHDAATTISGELA